MRFNKKQIISLVVALCFVGSFGSAEALSFKKKQNDVQAVSLETNNVKKSNKKKNKEQQPPYTNEVHSVFTLNDCIENAIKYNPSIQASIFNEEAYKTRIGQAWANYFPSISAGADVSRN